MPVNNISSIETKRQPYIQLPEALFFSELSGTALKVFCGLESYARGSGECWPSLATLSERLNLITRHLRRGLREWDEAGFLKTQQRIGRVTSHYILHAVAYSPKGTKADTVAWRGSPVRADSTDTVAWRGSPVRADMTDSGSGIPMAEKPYESDALNHIHESWANRPEIEPLKAGTNKTENPPIPPAPPANFSEEITDQGATGWQIDQRLKSLLELPAAHKLKHLAISADGQCLEVKFVSSAFNDDADVTWLTRLKYFYPLLDRLEIL
jgi:hypothetical protein